MEVPPPKHDVWLGADLHTYRPPSLPLAIYLFLILTLPAQDELLEGRHLGFPSFVNTQPKAST